MGRPIRIKIDDSILEAELNDTATAKSIYETLPIEEQGNRWGQELYFTIPASGEADEAVRDELAVGELAFWPPGKAFCIFWGPTPASRDDEPRAASNVVPIGMITSDLAPLRQSTDGCIVRIEARD